MAAPRFKIPDALERTGELDEDRRAVGVGVSASARSSSRTGGGFVAGGRASSGAREGWPTRAPQAPAVAASVSPSSRRSSDGALEVVAEQLIGDRDRRPVPAQPVREALVQLGAQLLGHAVVGAVADQLVAEAEGVFARRRPGG